MLKNIIKKSLAIILCTLIILTSAVVNFGAKNADADKSLNEIIANNDFEAINVLTQAQSNKEVKEEVNQKAKKETKEEVKEELKEEVKIKSELSSASTTPTINSAVESQNTTNEQRPNTKKEVTVDKLAAARSIINRAALNPKSPQSSDLDAMVDSIMDSIVTENMDTYAKVKASYDYIVSTTKYGSHVNKLSSTKVGDVTALDINSKYGTLEGYGAVVLSAKTGLCNAYSSAFILMVREIGLEANLVRGYTKSARGGFIYHEWAEVTIDGHVYVFDTQLEQSLSKAGLGQYNAFCKTYDEIGHRYKKI